MGRIEEAIQRLQQRNGRPAPGPNQLARRTSEARPAPASRSAGIGTEHHYGGRPIAFDAEALRAQGLLTLEQSAREVAEQYRVIKRPLLINASEYGETEIDHGNLIMIASALSGEGKTFTCLNLCMSLAREKDWSVVLVDGDCSKPQLTRLFDAESEPGLIDLIKDRSLDFDSLVMPTDIPGLSFLPAGGADPAAAELLASGRMRSLVEEISTADKLRLIVFDSSPLLLTSEAPILAARAGQVVLVVKANATPRQAVTDAREKLDVHKPVAAILNQHASAGKHRPYGYVEGSSEYSD